MICGGVFREVTESEEQTKACYFGGLKCGIHDKIQPQTYNFEWRC